MAVRVLMSRTSHSRQLTYTWPTLSSLSGYSTLCTPAGNVGNVRHEARALNHSNLSIQSSRILRQGTRPINHSWRKGFGAYFRCVTQCAQALQQGND
jgi:hypothetical protein